MKDDLISRQAAIDALRRAEALTRAFGYHNVIETIRELPPAQPERKKGKWLPDTRTFQAMWVCSNCKTVTRVDMVNYKSAWNYCPHCGADMRGEEE